MAENEYLDYLSLPSKLYNEIESNVTTLLLDLGISNYPVDPISIADRLGYRLIPFNKMSKEAKKFLIDKEVDGISNFDPFAKEYVIYYKPDGSKERLKFTIGHEIGHIRMGHKHESELARRIADYYSAYLLAPSPWIGFAGCEDFLDVASTFAISNACAMRCFERFEHWRQIPFKKLYEKDLIALLKNGSKKE